jgi:hypothetical protein
MYHAAAGIETGLRLRLSLWGLVCVGTVGVSLSSSQVCGCSVVLPGKGVLDILASLRSPPAPHKDGTTGKRGGENAGHTAPATALAQPR